MNNNNQSSALSVEFIWPAFLFLLIFIACNYPAAETSSVESPFVKDTGVLKKAEWLLGKWAGPIPGGVSEETWKRVNDSTYLGTGLFMKGKDTLSSELIKLEQVGNDLFYSPLVSNQNDGKSVAFRLTNATENELIFENPAHDFPQRITYRKITNDSMVAQISGLLKGKENTRYFPMKRVR